VYRIASREQFSESSQALGKTTREMRDR